VFAGFFRYNLHHELCTQMEEYHVELTIQRALEKFPGYNPRIISDNGSQFMSGDFKNFLREVGLTHVRTSRNYPQSNGKIERFHRTLKDECLSKQSLIDLDDAKQQIVRYIDKYNTKRLHSALNYLTPEDYLLGRVESRLNERNLKLNQAVENRKNYAKLHLN
ncbi:MAG: integrase, partial [Deltaproteobacteria bacterium CG07_land_8_20_14_0_80_38_7]